MAELSAGTLAVEGFQLIGREKRAVAAWAGIYLIGMVVLLGALFGIVGSSLGPLLTPGRAADAEMMTAMKAVGAIYVVALPLGLLAQAVMICAVYRAILRPNDRSFFFLRVGADELRMMLVSFLLLLIAGLLPLAVAVAVGGAVAAAPGTGLKVLVGLGGGVAGLCLLAWIGVRLCLASPMTFFERKVRLFGSWGLTRGRFWPLLGAFLLAFALTMVVSIFMQIIMGIIVSLSGGALAGLLAPGARIDRAMLMGLAPAIGVYAVVAALASLLQMLIFLAPLAAAYRDVAVDPVSMADTFA